MIWAFGVCLFCGTLIYLCGLFSGMALERQKPAEPRAPIHKVLATTWQSGAHKIIPHPHKPRHKRGKILTAAEFQTVIEDTGAPTEVCCVCDRPVSDSYYENYKGQKFCWPCADGKALGDETEFASLEVLAKRNMITRLLEGIRQL